MGAQPSNRPSRTRPSFRLAAALLLLVVTAASLRPAPSAKAAPADGLWVATADGLSKRSPVDGGLLLSVAGTPDARFLAVDEQRGRVWLMNVAANKAWRLRAFAMDGAFILEVNLNLPKRPPLGMVDIALEGDSGVVAVAYPGASTGTGRMAPRSGSSPSLRGCMSWSTTRCGRSYGRVR